MDTRCTHIVRLDSKADTAQPTFPSQDLLKDCTELGDGISCAKVDVTLVARVVKSILRPWRSMEVNHDLRMKV